MSDHKEFEQQNLDSIKAMASDQRMAELTRDWFNYSFKHRYSYHFKWLGNAHNSVSAGYNCYAGTNLGD